MKQIFLFLIFCLPVCAFSQPNRVTKANSSPAPLEEVGESFDNPSLTFTYPWTGDVNRFRVNDAGQLQLAGDRGEKSARLWLPIVFYPSMEWEFEVEMHLNPTNPNHVKVYLYSTYSSIINKVDEYYLQIGSNKRDITFKRLREDEKTPQVLIAGKENWLDKESVALSVKLTLEQEREWKLYTRMEGDAGYTLQGSYAKPLSDLRPSGYFRLECIYSKTHTDDFFFDNIRISPDITSTPLLPDNGEEDTPPDTPSTDSSPVLSQLEEESATSLLLYFNRAVNVETASFILDTGGESEEVYISEDETVVKAVWNTMRRKGESYTLTYSGVLDKDKKVEGKGSSPFVSRMGTSESLPSFPSGSLIISEIMADPKGLTSFPETEYVELYNASGSAIQLKDWDFIYGGKPVSLTDYMLPSGAYLLVYREGREIRIDKGGHLMPLSKFPSALANTGKELQLKDPSGQLIDAVTYQKAKPAVAWERSDNAWYLSTDPRGGTPGASNSSPSSGDKEDPSDHPSEPDSPGTSDTPDPSPEPDQPGGTTPDPSKPPLCPSEQLPQPGEVIFNELLPDPFPDGSEYIELYNRSDRPLCLAGLSIATRKSDGSLNTRYPLSSTTSDLEPGGYALLTKRREGVTSFYLISSPSNLYELKLPVLANTSSTLVLFRTDDGVVVDEVAYSSKWHASSVKKPKGVALERIDPDQPTQQLSNWTSATESAGYGTPGYRNSQFRSGEPGHATGIEAPVFSDITGYYTIAYYFDTPGYHCRAWIYDTSGRIRAEIANHELLGTEGEITWKGESRDNRPLRPGIYILYVEVYHEQGDVRSFKKAFLVH